MKAYELTLAKHKEKFILTERVALPIMRRFENREIGTAMIPEYGIMFDVGLIREIRAVEISEPYPKQFKEMLIKEGKMELPAPLDKETERIRGLPTTQMYVDSNHNEIILSRKQIHDEWRKGKKEFSTYYIVTAHCEQGAFGDTIIYSDFGVAKEVIKFAFDPEHPEYDASVVGRWVYGKPERRKE